MSAFLGQGMVATEVCSALRGGAGVWGHQQIFILHLQVESERSGGKLVFYLHLLLFQGLFWVSHTSAYNTNQSQDTVHHL